MNENEKKNNIHIEPFSVLRDLIKNLWVIILAAIIGFMLVDIWNSSTYTPMYTSTTTLIVNLKNSATYSYTNLSSSSELANIFTNVFVQPTMKSYAADHLGMDSFEGSVTSKVLSDTNIFTVSVSSSSPETSYRELCAILEIYPQISESVVSDAVIEVMRYPNLPKGPSNSISVQDRTIAVIGCALVVAAIVVWLSVTRDTVKDEKSFKENVDAKLFGIVGHERAHQTLRDRILKLKQALLITNAFASFRFTEQYHKIATKLEYERRHNGAKIILLTSLAENEGKSTTAANIALALASRNNKVLLLDMDFKKPALHKIFGMQNEVASDLMELMSGKVALENFAFTPYKNIPLSLGLNKRNYKNYAEWIYAEQAEKLFANLRSASDYDFVIIDTPPLAVAADVMGLMNHADSSLLVVRTDCVYTAAINDAVLSMNEAGKFTGCILNDVHREFTVLGQLGFDESGYYGRSKKHGAYYGYHNYSGFNDSENT